MAFLAVRRLRYDGKNYSYESPILSDGLNIVVGANGSGKSTFSDLIYFGLGGKVEGFSSGGERHAEIMGDSSNYVELLITIDNIPYTLKRFIGTNDIGVFGGDISDVLPLNRGEGRSYVFSDWILNKLRIEPVLLQYGTYTGKLNFTDLMRLIYHNQAPDPSGIFKGIENNSFVTDSKIFRRAIFEILIGKSFQEYYSSLAAFRAAEREKTEASKSLELFKEMSGQLLTSGEDLNAVFLRKRLDELRSQHERLLEYRKQLATAPPPKSVGINLVDLQRQLLAAEMDVSALSRTEAGLLSEISRYEQLKADLMLEATQIKKMMFAHEELQLFNANTCPYCLNNVVRVPNKCVCGHEVQEGDYERFFYNSKEYLAILKSRQKNVQTLEGAVQGAKNELADVKQKKARATDLARKAEGEIVAFVDESDVTINLQEFEATEEKLSEVRNEVAKLEQQFELEKRRERLEQELQAAIIKVNTLRTKTNQLEALAEADIEQRRVRFSEKYNEMMRDTVENCRVATIDADYMPVVNNGEYMEASANVPRRLLYYATMLYMSVTSEEITFPRFLLIDTPETAGIDAANLKGVLAKVAGIIQENKERPCQVILTTGPGKFPEDVSANMIGTLHSVEGGRLLKRKVQSV
jgi:DNA repair exonuclease SbcCD ATPase subunit